MIKYLIVFLFLINISLGYHLRNLTEEEAEEVDKITKDHIDMTKRITEGENISEYEFNKKENRLNDFFRFIHNQTESIFDVHDYEVNSNDINKVKKKIPDVIQEITPFPGISPSGAT